jgi:thioredoxin-related protein
LIKFKRLTIIANIKIEEINPMMHKFKYIPALILILAISSFSCGENSKNNGSAGNVNKEIKWEKISEGLKNAKELKKPVLIYFYTDWCIYCKKMDSEVFNDPEISEYMNENYISMRVNPEKEGELVEIMNEKITPAQLMAYTGSKGFPATLVLDEEKKPVTTLPGFIEKKTFLPILKFLNEKCYQKKISLDDYIINPELCRAK